MYKTIPELLDRFEENESEDNIVYIDKQIQNAVLDRKSKKGGIKMVESQSRYGIMEELSQVKIQMKTELANLESAGRKQESATAQNIANMRKELLQKTSSYKTEHDSWKVMRNLEKKNVLANAQTQVARIDEEIKFADERLEPDFKAYKENLEQKIKDQEAYLGQYRVEQEAAKKAKSDSITEIDGAITSLKEISKEHN